ncbi:hypothetical protein F5883DRAFT_229891 [Diaporthe sp. PMI_573]|nr:hypothetical protein F5883DRAFT_229891 [Diaporthaceae sp. PMI_573]
MDFLHSLLCLPRGFDFDLYDTLRTLAIPKEQKEICVRVIDHSVGLTNKTPLPHRWELKDSIECLREFQKKAHYHLRYRTELLIRELQRVLEKKDLAAQIKAKRRKDVKLDACSETKNGSVNSTNSSPSSGYQPTPSMVVPAFEWQPDEVSGGKGISQADKFLVNESQSSAKQPAIIDLPAPQPVVCHRWGEEWERNDDTKNVFITREQEEMYHKQHRTNESLMRSIYRLMWRKP